MSRRYFLLSTMLIGLFFLLTPSAQSQGTPDELYTTQMGLIFNYPTGWLISETPEGVLITNNDTMYEYGLSAFEYSGPANWGGTVEAPEIVAGDNAILIRQLSVPLASTVEDTAQQFIESAQETGNISFTFPALITIGDKTAARAYITSADRQTLVVVVDMGNNQHVLIAGTAALGEIQQIEPTLFTIAESFHFGLDVVTLKNSMVLNIGSIAVLNVSLASDGKTLAIETCRLEGAFNVCEQRDIIVWDISTNSQLGTVEVGQGAGIALSPDGKILAVGEEYNVILFDWANQRPLMSLVANVPECCDPRIVSYVHFTPDGQHLVTVADEVMVWDIKTGALLSTTYIGDDFSYYISSPDSSKGVVKTWESDAIVRDTIGNILQEWQNLSPIQFNSDSTQLLLTKSVGTVSEDPSYEIVDISSGETLLHRQVEENIISASLSPDGTLLAIAYMGCDDNNIELIDLATGQIIANLVGHQHCITSLGFSSDSKTLISASNSEDFIRIWDLSTVIANLGIKE